MSHAKYLTFGTPDENALTVAIVYLCTILHPLMWVFFWSKCVKLRVFCILQDFASTNVDALKKKSNDSFTLLIIHACCHVYD